MKISINLLPPEFMAERVKNAKFYKIQAIGVAIILFMTFLTSLTVALRILQSHNIALVKASVDQTEQKVIGLQGTQKSLIVLKNRLAVIGQFLGTPSQQTQMYYLIDKLIPSQIQVSEITVDKSGAVEIIALSPDSASLDTVVSNLTDKESNQSKISQVSIESLNRGRDGLYRISFKIKPN